MATLAPKVKITFKTCDISRLASTEQVGDEIIAEVDRLDIVMLKAGIMAVDAAVSVDGYEIQMATNHLGHAMLIRRLMPLLKSTAKQYGEARVVNLTSIAYTQAPRAGVEFATLTTPQKELGGLIPGGKYSRHGQSKLAH
ncbi:hypothetical protein LTR62_000684 [Meristemomyces frigidus]|uniref:Oxidoreductase n=1 Tax=Meristemomyces frigidus TaxID=1508187 RepID=A0AAN7TCS9_9PEZI|nr:hypothetical protein LTR62_000684 [Meristemomyces frigidus]